MWYQQARMKVAAAYVVLVALMALVVGVTGPWPWMVVACAALLPPVIMLRFWTDRPATMSETIREVLR